MAKIRIVMVTVPPLLAELTTRAAVERAELDFVAQLSERKALAARLKRFRSHVVIIGLRANEPDTTVRALLTQLPASKFVSISHDGRSIVGYQLLGNQIELSDLSTTGDLIGFMATAAADVEA